MSAAIDYRQPEYQDIFSDRYRKLKIIRNDPQLLQTLKLHYKFNPWDFIRDWGMCFEPRNIEKKLIPVIPFIPFPRQEEFLKWLYDMWANSESGLVEKTRDFGASWLCGAFAATMFIFNPGFTAGFGSRKEELVDKKDDPKSIFEKIRFFIDNLPAEFMPEGYNKKTCTSFLKIINPENGATITGEAGDNIGRGARMSIYFVDESAFIQRQDAKDAALSQTTNCQIDVSTPNGNGNAFFKKRMSNRVPVFVMDWRDDPRKSQEWYDKQVKELDEVIVAQEIDRDYNASMENIFIPAKYVEAIVDAHKKLGWDPVGQRRVAFDPADVGDAKAIIYRHGNVIKKGEQKRDGDITDAVPWAKQFVHGVNSNEKVDLFISDDDGMGAPIVKLAIKDDFQASGIKLFSYRGGSNKIKNPDNINEYLKKPNRDCFKNIRAQNHYNFFIRCQKTYTAVVKGKYISPSEMISIDSDGFSETDLIQLKSELSRALRKYTGDGLIRVESKSEMKSRGVDSPNMGDAAIMSEEIDTATFKNKPLPMPKVNIA